MPGMCNTREAVASDLESNVGAHEHHVVSSCDVRAQISEPLG